MSWRDKRKTGIALLLVGVAFVGVALLFSLVLPRALQKRIADDMCVSSKEDTYYDQWVRHFMISRSRERNWNRNPSRNCFWDWHWGRADQLLANFSLSPITVPGVFAKVNSAQFPSRF